MIGNIELLMVSIFVRHVAGPNSGGGLMAIGWDSKHDESLKDSDSGGQRMLQ